MASSSSVVYADVPSPLPPLPEKRIVVGFGGVGIDYLATVVTFPKPDDKIRSTSLKVQGGGNAGNALTSAARLGLNPRVISKVSEEGNSSFTYVIVDNETKTRTCIFTPGHPLMTPGHLSQSSLISALDGARLVYFDGRFPDTALVVAKEATRMQIPILIDAEKKREGLDDLLNLADYVVCSAKFPQSMMRLSAGLIGTVSGRLLVGTAEKIPPSELIDTTGAGDAFIGAILYAICAGMPPEKMLPFAAQVAAAGCRSLGARTGLPRRTDPRLDPFLR